MSLIILICILQKYFQVQLEVRNIQWKIIDVQQLVISLRQDLAMKQSRALQSLNLCQPPKDDPGEIKQYKQHMDNQMDNINSQLILFEGHLKKEQVKIKCMLAEKDKIIILQRDTILKLVDKNKSMREEFLKVHTMLQREQEKINAMNCENMCQCECHKRQLFGDIENITKGFSEISGNVYEIIHETEKDNPLSQPLPSTNIDDEIEKMDNVIISECTISLESSQSKPRQIVESGSIQDLAKHHRKRRASGGSSLKDKDRRSDGTRSKSLPDGKLLQQVMQARTQSLILSGLNQEISNNNTTTEMHDSMTMQQAPSKKGAKQTSNSSLDNYKVVENIGVHSESSQSLPQSMDLLNSNTSGKFLTDPLRKHKVEFHLGEDVSEEPPQFYDIDDDSVFNEDFGFKNGKFKNYKSPPSNETPTKPPRRPRDVKKRSRLKSDP